ncbi:hypothetical protein D3C72_1468570 [compost metagenome]
MGNRQVQARFVDRLRARDQVSGHAQCLRGRHARVTPCQYKLDLAQQQFLKGLGQVGRAREGQLLSGKGAELRGHSGLFRHGTGMAVQVLCFVVDQCRVLASPDQVVVFQQGWMDVVQGLQLADGQRRVRQHVHAPAAHFVQGLGAFAGIKQFDLEPQLPRHLLQQIGAGTDQVFGIVRVLPQVRRCVRAAGYHKALAFACSDRQRRQ